MFVSMITKAYNLNILWSGFMQFTFSQMKTQSLLLAMFNLHVDTGFLSSLSISK